jgi:hypothetical protein
VKSRVVNFGRTKSEDADTLEEKMKNIPRISLYHKPTKAWGKKKEEEKINEYDEFEDDKLFVAK